MAKYLYGAILVAILVFMAAVVSYRLQSHEVPTVSQRPSTAEFGGVALRIEFATTTTARYRGLGGRTSIPDDYGMLFVFKKAGMYGFWMKDMVVPIDIFWLDSKGQVTSIAFDVATSSYPHVFYPSAPALYVLETAAGFARRHRIVPGIPLLLQSFPGVSE